MCSRMISATEFALCRTDPANEEKSCSEPMNIAPNTIHNSAGNQPK